MTALRRQVGQRQAAAFLEFWLVRQVPAQYRACLAEAVRRRAYGQLYAGQAAQVRGPIQSDPE